MYFLILILFTMPLWADEDHAMPAHQHEERAESEDHEASEHGHEEEQNSVHLSPEQMQAAGIKVQAIQLDYLPEEIEAPGEVKLNLYASSQVTPRIEAQVIQRHVRMGDEVKKGQPLVTLSSATMAEAQGQALIAAKEWKRIKNIKRELVSDKQFIETQIDWQQAQARLLAYGMTAKQIQQLVRNTDLSQANGDFVLLSPQDGTVIADDFILGQMVEPGDVLFQITDESQIWVEAHVNPEQMHRVKIGAAARIKLGDHWLPGQVIQIHHLLDETTRTMGVRLLIPNAEDHLHPGLFVNTRIQVGQAKQKALILPLEAVLRSPDGDWQVFIAKEEGEFEPVEVQLLRQTADQAMISGLAPGTPVVVQGAFFVQSELAKSGFAVHNH